MSVCCKCNVIVFEHFFTCAGECTKTIHYSCIGIKKPVFDVISTIPNFFRRCDECMDFQKSQNSHNEILLKSINTITTTMISLKETSSIICNRIEKIDPSLNSNNIANKKINSNNKNVISPATRVTRSKFNERDATATTTSINTTLKSTVDTNDAKADDEKKGIVIGCGALNSSLPVAVPLKWIFISRLHKDVADNDIKLFIVETFGINDPVLIRIKRKLENEERNYASFIVGVPEDSFDKLLNPSSWPKGTLVKEFVSYRNIKQNFLVPRSAFIPANQISADRN